MTCPRIHRWLFAGLLLLFGCGRSDDQRVHVTYWEKWTGREGEAMQAVVDAFNRSQNRIFVEYLAVSNANQKALVATAGGDPPDIAGLLVYDIYSFADSGALESFDDFLRADGLTQDAWLSRYDPSFAALGTYQGRLWALPSTPTTVALHWNKTLFREAGLDPERPPRTLEELDTFAEKLTRRDPKTGEILQLGFLPQEPGWWAWAFVFSFGGQLWDGQEITVAKRPENLQTYKWIEGYTRKYGLDAIKAFSSGFGNFSSPQSAFFSGKVAMVLQGVWLNNFIRQYAPGLEYGVSGWPAAPHGPPNFTVADADVVVIPRGAKHPKEAWEFIKYVSTSNPSAQSKDELRGMELLCYLQEKNSPLKTWSPFFTDHHPHPYVGLFRELGASPGAVSIPKIGIWQEYFRELTGLFDNVRLLVQTPEDGLTYAQQRVGDSWTEHKRSLARRGVTLAPERPTGTVQR